MSALRFRGGPPGCAGFTLLEVLIATTLLAIMMLLLTSSLRIGAESWDAGEERMAQASRLFIVANFLRAHIASLLPVGGTVKNGQLEPAFRGGLDDLTYVAPLPEQVEAGGLYRFRLYLAEEGERRDLRMNITPYTTGPQQDETPEPLDDVPLLENVKAFRLSYLGPAGPGQSFNPAQAQPLQWTGEWRNNQLPTLIRIDIEPEGEAPWPSLFIPIRTLMLR